MRKHQYILLLGWLVSFILVGCGSGPQPTRLPTSTPIPTYEFIPPTEAPEVVAASTPTLDAAAVERGRERYEDEELGCAGCHGEQGEGTDLGPPLTTSTISLNDFITLMRSGGSIGSSHQFSTNRLSDSGGRNLYQYLLSIR
jgi:mono/diheme cytochrome c family protein